MPEFEPRHPEINTEEYVVSQVSNDFYFRASKLINDLKASKTPDIRNVWEQELLADMTPRAKDYYKGKYDHEPTPDQLNRVLEKVIACFLEDMDELFDEA